MNPKVGRKKIKGAVASVKRNYATFINHEKKHNVVDADNYTDIYDRMKLSIANVNSVLLNEVHGDDSISETVQNGYNFYEIEANLKELCLQHRSKISEVNKQIRSALNWSLSTSKRQVEDLISTEEDIAIEDRVLDINTPNIMSGLNIFKYSHLTIIQKIRARFRDVVQKWKDDNAHLLRSTSIRMLIMQRQLHEQIRDAEIEFNHLRTLSKDLDLRIKEADDAVADSLLRMQHKFKSVIDEMKVENLCNYVL